MEKLFRLNSLSLLLILATLSPSLKAAEYYVVIGAFSKEANAREFTSEVRNFFTEVSYSFSDTRKLYYVHVLKTTRKEEARNWTLYLKNEKGFRDAWIFTESDDERNVTSTVPTAATKRTSRYSADRVVAADHTLATVSNAPSGEVLLNSERIDGDASLSEMAWTNQWGIDYIADIKGNDPSKVKDRLASGQLLKFIIEDSEGSPIPAEVMLVDFEKIKMIASFNNGEHAAIRGTRPNQMVTFVCDVLGFNPETRMYNIDHLSRGHNVKKNTDGVWEVKFKLKKIGINEFSSMNKTSFFKDAAVLQPSSKEEVQQLLSIMKSNPGYRIIIHSHCNPGGSREIKIPGSDDVFDLSVSSSKQGSARKLTKERAATLRNYLVSHGIAKNRVRIIGWGGLELMTTSSGPDSDINERIEIELVADEK